MLTLDEEVSWITGEGSRSQSQEESACVKGLPAAQVLALIYVTSCEDQINSAGNCL